MTIRTNIRTSHLVRLGIIGLFCLGFTALCFYDGLVRYPSQIVQLEEFLEFTEEHKDKLDPKDIVDQWKELAASKGWPTNRPNVEDPRTHSDIAGQFQMAAVLGPIGLYFLVQLLRYRGRWIEVNDLAITSSMKDQFELSQIVELNKKKWDKKGIAKIKYESEGRTKKLVLDDCYYQRETTDGILRHIEQHIDHAKIVGGKPEPVKKTNEESVEESQ